MTTIREKIYRFSGRLSARWFFLAMYYVVFFFLFFLLADETLIALPGQRLLSHLLSASIMGTTFTALHVWMLRKRR
jgi:hypothetical protein